MFLIIVLYRYIGYLFQSLKEVGRQRLEIILYLDVFVITNLGMNVLLLWMTAKILHAPVRRRQVAAAAALGTIGACMEVLLPQIRLGGWLWFAGTRVILSAGMVFLAFGKKHPEEWMKQLLVFWIVSAAAGGVFEAASFARNRSLLCFLCCAAGVYFGGRAAVLFLQESIRMQKNLYEVTLYYHGRTEQLTALRDTGNLLYEPYGHQPVHVITREAAKRLCENVDRVIYIPFSAVGTGYGILPGIRMDAMDVRKEGVLVRHCDMPWVAVSKEPLSIRHRYEMLLHGEEL